MHTKEVLLEFIYYHWIAIQIKNVIDKNKSHILVLWQSYAKFMTLLDYFGWDSTNEHKADNNTQLNESLLPKYINPKLWKTKKTTKRMQDPLTMANKSIGTKDTRNAKANVLSGLKHMLDLK